MHPSIIYFSYGFGGIESHAGQWNSFTLVQSTRTFGQAKLSEVLGISEDPVREGTSTQVIVFSEAAF